MVGLTSLIVFAFERVLEVYSPKENVQPLDFRIGLSELIICFLRHKQICLN